LHTLSQQSKGLKKENPWTDCPSSQLCGFRKCFLLMQKHQKSNGYNTKNCLLAISANPRTIWITAMQAQKFPDIQKTICRFQGQKKVSLSSQKRKIMRELKNNFYLSGDMWVMWCSSHVLNQIHPPKPHFYYVIW